MIDWRRVEDALFFFVLVTYGALKGKFVTIGNRLEVIHLFLLTRRRK